MPQEQSMGFEGSCYMGTLGATNPNTYIPETRDMSYDFTTDKGNTTVREADGSGNPLIPIETEANTVLKWQFSFQTLHVPNNATLAALLAHSYAGTPLAFRTKDKQAGKGYLGDVIIEHKHTKTLRGEQAIDWTVKPSRAGGRRPQFYVADPS
jgi:hypothetical protein